MQQHLGAKDERRIAPMQSLIRQAMGSRENRYRLTGFVHTDDTLFGGKSDRSDGKTGFEKKVRIQVNFLRHLAAGEHWFYGSFSKEFSQFLIVVSSVCRYNHSFWDTLF